MAKLSSKKASSVQSVIIYGAPKTGKTLLAGKLSEYYNIVWIDMENGHETLFQLPEAWQDNIELISLPDTRTFPIAIETVLKIVKGGPVAICAEHGKVDCALCKRELVKKQKDLEEAGDEKAVQAVMNEYFTTINMSALGSDDLIVFDSLTQLTNSAIAHITKKEPEDYKLTYDDWGNLGKLLDIFLSHIQQAKCNVVVISHETEAEGEGTKRKTLVPVAGTRNFSRNSAKYFGHVVYCERKNKKHVFASSTTYATNILTGSRTDISLEDLEEDSLLPIFKPELFSGKNADKQADNKSTASTSNKDRTDAILARLKTK